MNKPIVVEFAGLPGVGKSTVAGRTAARLAELTDRAVATCIFRPPLTMLAPRARRRIRKLISAPSMCLRLPVGGSWSWRDFASLVRFAYAAGWVASSIQRELRAQPSAIVLVDQGGVHALWQQYFKSKSDVSQIVCRKAFASMYCKGLRNAAVTVLYLEASSDIACQRFRHRISRTSRFHRDTPSALLAHLKSDCTYPKLLEMLRSSPCVNLMTASADSPVEEVVDGVVQKLKPLLESGARTSSEDHDVRPNTRNKRMKMFGVS